MTCDWCNAEATGRVELTFEDGQVRVLDLCDDHMELQRRSSKEKSPTP